MNNNSFSHTLKKNLTKIGIKKGDTVYLGINLGKSFTFFKDEIFQNTSLNKVREKSSKLIFKNVAEHLGRNGTIICPTFSFFFIREKKFNVNKSKSDLGYFENFFLRKIFEVIKKINDIKYIIENLSFFILDFSLYPLDIFMSKPDLIIHDEKDNVGVVVIETTKKGQNCNAWIMENDKTVNVPSENEVPLGHKIALKNLKVGDTIFKYGHDIGKVVKEIKKGEHVHVHNVKTKKW